MRWPLLSSFPWGCHACEHKAQRGWTLPRGHTAGEPQRLHAEPMLLPTELSCPFFKKITCSGWLLPSTYSSAPYDRTLSPSAFCTCLWSQWYAMSIPQPMTTFDAANHPCLDSRDITLPWFSTRLSGCSFSYFSGVSSCVSSLWVDAPWGICPRPTLAYLGTLNTQRRLQSHLHTDCQLPMPSPCPSLELWNYTGTY